MDNVFNIDENVHVAILCFPINTYQLFHFKVSEQIDSDIQRRRSLDRDVPRVKYLADAVESEQSSPPISLEEFCFMDMDGADDRPLTKVTACTFSNVSVPWLHPLYRMKYTLLKNTT